MIESHNGSSDFTICGKRFYTAREVAKILNITYEKVFYLMRKGTLPKTTNLNLPRYGWDNLEEIEKAIEDYKKEKENKICCEIF